MLNWDSDTAQESRFIPDWARALGLTRCFMYNGPSMLPTFRPGQILYVCATPQRFVPGDVIVFAHQYGSGYVTHRIIAIMSNGVITRGDNNARVDDGCVAFDQVIGRVELLEADGHIRPVLGGGRGLWLAQVRWKARKVERGVRFIFGAPYRMLRASVSARRILRRIVSLHLEYISIQTAQGSLVKILHRGKVVARWWQQTNHFECDKPYDLILSRPDKV